MSMTHEAYVRQPEFRWAGREVVRELNDRPHLLLRIAIGGDHFPHRDAPAFVRIVRQDGGVEESWFAEATEDGSALLGYFAPGVEAEGILEFGYGNRVMGRVGQPFVPRAVERLDRGRLPREVVEARERPVQAREVVGPEKRAVERREP